MKSIRGFNKIKFSSTEVNLTACGFSNNPLASFINEVHVNPPETICVTAEIDVSSLDYPWSMDLPDPIENGQKIFKC